jgi:hypothetical protein
MSHIQAANRETSPKSARIEGVPGIKCDPSTVLCNMSGSPGHLRMQSTTPGSTDRKLPSSVQTQYPVFDSGSGNKQLKNDFLETPLEKSNSLKQLFLKQLPENQRL